MSGPPRPGGPPITDKRQLVEYFASACTPRDEWRIGTEHEKFGFRLSDLASCLKYQKALGLVSKRRLESCVDFLVSMRRNGKGLWSLSEVILGCPLYLGELRCLIISYGNRKTLGSD